MHTRKQQQYGSTVKSSLQKQRLCTFPMRWKALLGPERRSRHCKLLQLPLELHSRFANIGVRSWDVDSPKTVGLTTLLWPISLLGVGCAVRPSTARMNVPTEVKVNCLQQSGGVTPLGKAKARARVAARMAMAKTHISNVNKLETKVDQLGRVQRRPLLQQRLQPQEVESRMIW